MMNEMERPDLSQVSAPVQAYIEALEAALARLQSEAQPEPESAAPTEPTTTVNVISISRQGWGKRTPRHFYGRQRRGGMGVFDLDTDAPDYPAHLALADENEHLLLLTNFGRAFRLPVDALAEMPVRAGGQFLPAGLTLREHEQIAVVLPADAGAYLVLASQRGWVQRLHRNRVGKLLIPGMTFHDAKRGGYVTGACWTAGEGELFMVTKQGKGIRFRESQVPDGGCLGLRVDLGDEVAAVTAVTAESAVFVLTHEGKGTRRQMETFAANKAPGAGGKLVMKTERVVGALTVAPGDDLFAISQLGKIIRFAADEVPVKEGAVQGVNCMALRNDTVTAVALAPMT